MGDRPDPSPTRPQAGRAGTLAVPCVLRRAAERAGVPGLGGGRAGGADQRRAHPTNTRATPYRIVNHPARNNRWNDPRHRFDHKGFLGYSCHVGTPRQFECSRQITAGPVKQTIERIPGAPRQNVTSDDSASSRSPSGRV
jgi:hypothetical protein